MPELISIKSSSVIRKYKVVVAKRADEDWGEIAGNDKRIKPNMACVIVSQLDEKCWSTWIQVREQDEGEGWTRCNGTRLYEDNPYWMPSWVIGVREFAVDAVRAQSEEGYAADLYHKTLKKIRGDT